AAPPTFTRPLTAPDGLRVQLAINNVGPIVTVLAVTGEANGTLKRSVDGGVAWSAPLAAATGFCDGQCFYDIVVAIDPTNASNIYIAGNVNGAATKEFG